MSRIWARVLVVAAVALTLGLATATPALAGHSWGSYHWARQLDPFTLVLHDNVTGPWDDVLQATSSDWTSSNVLNTTVLSENPITGRDLRRCNPTAGRVEVCNYTYGRNGWLGIATIWALGNHITQGTVKLNDSYHNSAPYDATAWRNLVSCQEVGHTFGLAHQNEAFGPPNLGTCMDYTNDPTGAGVYLLNNEHPNAHDYAQLEDMYGHLDATATVGAQPSSAKGRSLPAASGAACGEHGVPEHAGPQHGDTFICDLGNGERAITHVFWIPRGLPGAR